MKHRYMYVVYNYCIPFIESNTHIPAVVVAALRQSNPTVPTVLFMKSINQLTTYFNSFSDLFCCSALARAMAPVEVRELW